MGFREIFIRRTKNIFVHEKYNPRRRNKLVKDLLLFMIMMNKFSKKEQLFCKF